MTAVQWETEERRKEVRVMSNSGENRSGGRAIKKKKKNIYEAMHWASGCEPKELKPQPVLPPHGVEGGLAVAITDV